MEVDYVGRHTYVADMLYIFITRYTFVIVSRQKYLAIVPGREITAPSGHKRVIFPEFLSVKFLLYGFRGGFVHVRIVGR